MSWSLSPPETAQGFEWGAPSFEERLAAAKAWASAGYEVRFIFMPLLPVEGWRELYADALGRAFAAVRPARVTLGGICSYPGAMSATRGWLGEDNLISRLARSKHGRRLRFELGTRVEMYRHLREQIGRLAPEVPVSLCLESEAAWRLAGLDPRRCQCNCIAGEWNLLE